MQDYLDATDAMAKEPYIDAKRMGAVGASYGGTSVFYLAGIHGDDSRHLFLIAECSISQAGTDQQKSYGFLTRILRGRTGIIQKATSFHRT